MAKNLQLISDVVAERQRGNVLDGTGGQYVPYRIREFQRYRHPVAQNASIVIEFSEGKYVLHHNADVGVTFTGAHPELLNSRFGYVSISRASHEATLFTDDLNKLIPQTTADVSKTSAFDIHQAASIAQGISMNCQI